MAIHSNILATYGRKRSRAIFAIITASLYHQKAGSITSKARDEHCTSATLPRLLVDCGLGLQQPTHASFVSPGVKPHHLKELFATAVDRPNDTHHHNGQHHHCHHGQAWRQHYLTKNMMASVSKTRAAMLCGSSKPQDASAHTDNSDEESIETNAASKIPHTNSHSSMRCSACKRQRHHQEHKSSRVAQRACGSGCKAAARKLQGFLLQLRE
jgi:hypothetical protein